VKAIQVSIVQTHPIETILRKIRIAAYRFFEMACVVEDERVRAVEA
jgi:hypothetical protein